MEHIINKIIKFASFKISNLLFKIFNLLFRSKIRKMQHSLLLENYDPYSENLIIFMTPGYDIVSGGIMSISSIFEETVKLKEIHGSEAILCTVPKDPLLLKYTKFKNENYIYEFSKVLSYFHNLKSIGIHVPESFCGQFLDNLSEKDWKILDSVEYIHVNIMIQNIDIALNDLNDIKRLLKRFNHVTGTLAHKKYSNKDMREKFGFPLHKLSVYISPEQYNNKSYEEKEDLLVVSPDVHPQKNEILNMIKRKFPQIRIQIINGMKYEEYKKIISRAKWTLTFGEGLDGYFIESIFSGGISFSVYNSKFFTEDFKTLQTVYSDYDELIEKIVLDMTNLNNKTNYSMYHKKQYDLCMKYYDHKEYIKNIKLFYIGDYTYK